MKVLDDFDFTPKRPLEISEELQFVAWIENRGGLARKIQYPGRRDAPDRLVAWRGNLFLFEFKRDGKTKSQRGKISGGQSKEHKRFAEAGVTVHVFYTARDAISFCEERSGLLV